MRLSDVFYTTKNLDGTPEPPGKPTPIDFYQGEDIVFEVFLNFQDKAISTNEWDVNAYVKTNKHAEELIWSGELNNGLYKGVKEGMFKIVIPSETTTTMLAGTYWLALTIHEKSGKGPKDLDYVILNQPFSVNYSAASKNPNINLRTTERTYPPSSSADKS